jgi:hypothetical protein
VLSPPLLSVYDQILPVKIPSTLLAIVLAAAVLRAQDQVVEIDPIVVTGSFELRRAPAAVDSFTRYLEQQSETKRAEQEALARSPIWNARFWSLIPIRLESSIDSHQFFVPIYSTPEYREAARRIDDFRLHSLFDQQSKTRNWSGLRNGVAARATEVCLL